MEKFQSTPSLPDVETEGYFAVYVPVSQVVLASYEVGDNAKKRPMPTFINHMLFTSREQRSNTKVKGCIKNHNLQELINLVDAQLLLLLNWKINLT